MKVFAIIPSGGSGLRMNNPPCLPDRQVPKQYIRINGKEIIAYTLEVFQKCESIDEIIISACKDYFDLLRTIKNNYSFSKISKIVEGGDERQHSVLNALKSTNAKDNDLIVVHDAVRSLLPNDILIKSIETAKISGSAVVAIKAKDTLIKGMDSVVSYIDRQDVYYAQTPQVFQYKILLDAMNQAEKENFIGTDESMLVQRAGYKVKIVEGSSLNFKITNKDDIKLFELITRTK
ncbi:MAG: 2-C-methyl-D-erythritol 4-phosphate cytidylyltransferase [Ignavibacteriales bacterium]|nr:2-C-methyl-D-erythritol 4-phosphate cytidylyltransferase [Ignavibacteriales bacterium]